jgi:hypothetical protein
MSKRPRDPNQLAKLVVDIATGYVSDPESDTKRKPLSRRRIGGLKGGKNRALRLTPEQRRKIASNAAKARWKKL